MEFLVVNKKYNLGETVAKNYDLDKFGNQEVYVPSNFTFKYYRLTSKIKYCEAKIMIKFVRTYKDFGTAHCKVLMYFRSKSDYY